MYEYACESCGHRFEKIRKFSDPPLAECPECGGPLRKLVSSPAFQFKGSGWYITDYARKGESPEKNEKNEKNDKADKTGKDSSSKAADAASREAKESAPAKESSESSSKSTESSDKPTPK